MSVIRPTVPGSGCEVKRRIFAIADGWNLVGDAGDELSDELKDLEEKEEELTVFRVTLKGENAKGQTEEIVYNMHDEYCDKTNTSSMARTTGYTATAAANIILDGLFSEKGVFPPELVGKHQVCFDYFLSYLDDRNIKYVKSSRLL